MSEIGAAPGAVPGVAVGERHGLGEAGQKSLVRGDFSHPKE